MKRMILYTLLVFVAIGFSACDDWLDREPKTFIGIFRERKYNCYHY